MNKLFPIVLALLFFGCNELNSQTSVDILCARQPSTADCPTFTCDQQIQYQDSFALKAHITGYVNEVIFSINGINTYSVLEKEISCMEPFELYYYTIKVDTLFPNPIDTTLHFQAIARLGDKYWLSDILDINFTSYSDEE